MTSRHRGIFVRLPIFVLLMTTAARPANAGSILTKTDVVLVGVAVGAVGAAIGVGVYYAVHHDHSVTGCAASGPNGLQLQTQDNQIYTLIGNIAAIRPGERVRASGKKRKSTGASQEFLVEKLSKDYGACPVRP